MQAFPALIARHCTLEESSIRVFFTSARREATASRVLRTILDTVDRVSDIDGAETTVDVLSLLCEGHFDELSSCDDSRVAELAQAQQVFVLGHNEVRLRCEGAFENAIIVRVLRDDRYRFGRRDMIAYRQQPPARILQHIAVPPKFVSQYAQGLINSIVVVDRERIRRRWLPV
jgi:hypothetical protein